MRLHGMEYDQTGLTQPNALHITYRFPAEGDYAFRVVLTGQRPPASEPTMTNTVSGCSA